MRAVKMTIAAGLLLLSGAAAANAQKAGKQNYICGPNGIAQCMSACSSRGGQVRHCPRWCEDQRRQRCR